MGKLVFFDIGHPLLMDFNLCAPTRLIFLVLVSHCWWILACSLPFVLGLCKQHCFDAVYLGLYNRQQVGVTPFSVPPPPLLSPPQKDTFYPYFLKFTNNSYKLPITPTVYP